ncbi:MAG TPA: VOC family protein [Candidatus Eisenbacteria bacterium]|nr:VOC family protein [Candidatus Eisenbacteria bacterium]
MIKPIALSATHMECRSLEESLPVLTDLLAFEKIAEAPGEATLKHPNTDWRLVVHESGAEAPVKQMHNHWGVRVATSREVDAAYEYLTANKQKYRIPQIGKPLYNHGSYSLYFIEPGTNGWEIECYESAMRKESLVQRVGGVYAPHWTTPYPEEKFPGRGYVPQGFTHGTLACANLETSRKFYNEVMGLATYQANPNVFYIKHPDTKCYVVCAQRQEFKRFSPNFRFTVTLASRDDVAEAHERLKTSATACGYTELGALETDGSVSRFLISDPDQNWWEVTSAAA